MRLKIVFAGVFAAGGVLAVTSPEASFLAGNQVAMSRMMSAMPVKPSGNVDADFVNMMEPHHQGAIDMAVLELKYGHNEQLRRIAQGIVVEQRQEIGAMRLALGRPIPVTGARGPRDAALQPSAVPTRPASNFSREPTR